MSRSLISARTTSAGCDCPWLTDDKASASHRARSLPSGPSVAHPSALASPSERPFAFQLAAPDLSLLIRRTAQRLTDGDKQSRTIKGLWKDLLPILRGE